MNQMFRIVSMACALFALSACATVSAPSPVEVTRFHNAEELAANRGASFFIEARTADNAEALEWGPYARAIARELEGQGFRKSARDEARVIARFSVERYRLTSEGARSPVSVGVGGSTGSYGSGIGVGIGLNLGAGPRERIGTELRVVLEPVEGQKAFWEGRASFEADRRSPLAEPAMSANVLARALFDGFPGANGETLRRKIPRSND